MTLELKKAEISRLNRNEPQWGDAQNVDALLFEAVRETKELLRSNAVGRIDQTAHLVGKAYEKLVEAEAYLNEASRLNK